LKQSNGGGVQPIAIIRDDVILAHTNCKKMDLCPIRAFFQRKAILFLTNLPQS